MTSETKQDDCQTREASTFFLHEMGLNNRATGIPAGIVRVATGYSSRVDISECVVSAS